jgi:hypothetical protein
MSLKSSPINRRTFLKLSTTLCASPLALPLEHAHGQGDSSPALFPVCVSGRWGYIDTTGRMVIPPRFENASSFSRGLAPVKRKDRWGFIDTKGKWIIEPRYKYAFCFGEGGLGLVDMEDGGRAFIDRTGRTAIRFSEGERPNGFAEGLCSVAPSVPLADISFIRADGKSIEKPAASLPRKVWFMDIHGERAFSEEFDYAWLFREGLSAVKVADQYGFIDRTGKFVISPRYENAAFFSEGIACVRQNGRDRYIDRDGRNTLPREWEDASFFSGGLAAVCVDNKWGYINKQGDMVIAPAFESADPFHEGRATCRLDGKYGVIDTAGKWIVSPRHAYVGWYGNGIASYSDTPADPDGARRGYLDRNGKIVWPAPPFS